MFPMVEFQVCRVGKRGGFGVQRCVGGAAGIIGNMVQEYHTLGLSVERNPFRVNLSRKGVQFVWSISRREHYGSLTRKVQRFGYVSIAITTIPNQVPPLHTDLESSLQLYSTSIPALPIRFRC